VLDREYINRASAGTCKHHQMHAFYRYVNRQHRYDNVISVTT